MKPGATLDIVEDRSDMVINSRSYSPSFVVEYLYPYYPNPVSLIVPKAEPIYWTTAVMDSYHWSLKVVLTITFFLVFLINHLLHPRSTSVHFSILEVFSYLLLFSFTSNRNYRGIHKFFLITWSLFCIIFASIINGGLYSNFVVVRYAKDINTLDELLQTDYQIPITRARMSLLEMNSAPTKMLSKQYWKLKSRFVIFESLAKIFEQIEMNEKYAFLQTNGHSEYFVSKKQFDSEAGGPIYHLMTETVGMLAEEELL